MFRPHLQPSSGQLTNRSSTFNVRTVWDPIVCTIMIYIYVIQTTVKMKYLWIKYAVI